MLDISQDDKIALYAFLLLQQQDKVKHQQKILSAIAKEADANGVRWPDIKAAVKEYEQTPEARRERTERLARIYEAVGAPVQLELFDAYEPKREDDVETARKKGRFAAVMQGDDQPPYAAGSPEGQAWLDGWHDIHKLVAEYEASKERAAAEHDDSERDEATTVH